MNRIELLDAALAAVMALAVLVAWVAVAVAAEWRSTGPVGLVAILTAATVAVAVANLRAGRQ